MNLFTFIANFFRQGSAESSTRLVGILGFLAGTVLAFVVVLTGKADATALGVVGVIYANSAVALGLRKSPTAEGGPGLPVDEVKS